MSRSAFSFLSMAVVVLSMAVVVAACNSAPPPPPFRPVADVKVLMSTLLEPAADEYWDAVGTVEDLNGVEEIQPQTAEDWERVRHNAYVIAEAGNLLMMGGRAKDGGDWMTHAIALVESGQRAIRAAEARDKKAVFDTGAEVYDVCTACHAQYALELQRPNTR